MEEVDLVIRNSKVVSPDGIVEANIAVKDGKIGAIAEAGLMPAAKETIDAKGRYVLPGVIEPHSHLNQGPDMLTDSFECEKDNFVTETRSAAVGGVTTIMTLVFRDGSPLLSSFYDETRKAYEERAHIDGVFNNLILGPKQVEEIPEAIKKYGVAGFKFLMAYKGREAATINLKGSTDMTNGLQLEGFRKIAEVGDPAVAMVHAEDVEIFFDLADKLMGQGREDLLAYTEARPDYMEELAVVTALFLQKVAGNAMYLVHLGGVGVDHVAKAKSEGRKVYAETCPHYLTFDVRDESVQKFGKLARLNPALKTKELGEKLWWGIQNGIIDSIGTDHCALTTELKDKLGNIWTTVPGFPGVATLLPVILSEGVNKGRIKIEKVAEITSANTAKIFGLYPRKGTIAVGSDADFTIVDLNKEQKVTPELLQSRSDYTLYDGWVLKGWPVMTIVRGKVVMKDGKVIGEQGWGRVIPRGKVS